MEAAQVADAAPVRRWKRRGNSWERPPKKQAVPNGPGPGRPRKELAPKSSHKPYHPKCELALMLLQDESKPFLRAEVEQYQTMGLLGKAQEFFDVTLYAAEADQRREPRNPQREELLDGGRLMR